MAQHRERGIYKFATPRLGRITLPWHFKNEVEHYGCLDLRPCYDSRCIGIANLMESDSLFYKDVEPMRYTEADEFSYASWEMRMHPWEDERKGCLGLPNFGYDRKRAIDYVDRRLYGIVESHKYDRVGVAYKPFGGKPMICCVKDGKVTLT